MPPVSGQRWSCHSCGHCCRSLVGHLFDADRKRIDQLDWVRELGVPPYVRAGRNWVLNKRPDGACVFLDEDNRCLIHARSGEPAKPLACRIFPFSLRPVRHGWQASLRYDCPSVRSSKGTPITQYRAWLADLSGELDHDAPVLDDTANLERGVRASVEEVEAVIARFTRWFKDDNPSMMDRLVGAARVTSTLQHARFRKVRGRRFMELIDLLFAALPAELTCAPDEPTPRQRRLLRLLAFAHAEHVTLAEMRSGVIRRLGKRWQQLRGARRFWAGRGIIPHWPGFDGDVRFEAVEAIHPDPEHERAVGELLNRYVAARLQARSVFGRGYYGWRVFDGLAALWTSVAAVGWLGRCLAAGDGSKSLRYDDIARALGVVDRAATRVPALGTAAERARTAYLSRDDGVARLLHRYAPASPGHCLREESGRSA